MTQSPNPYQRPLPPTTHQKLESIFAVIRRFVTQGLRARDLVAAVRQVKLTANYATVNAMASKIRAGKL